MPMRHHTQITRDLPVLLARLTAAKNESDDAFFAAFLALGERERARVITELPDTYQKDICAGLGTKKLAHMVNKMRTDDATDFMILLKSVDEAKWLGTIELMDATLTEAVQSLMDYSEEESGSLMQIEIFTVTKNETIRDSMRRLRKLVDTHALEHITTIFLVDREHHLLALFPLERVVSADEGATYGDIYDRAAVPISVHSRSSVYEAARLMTRYDLNVLPVINKNGRLLGRITHDDILDHIQEDATKQMYGLGQVDPEEEIEEGVIESGKDRAFWLVINLVNVTIISIVIGLFEHSLHQVVALAILMPVVANMAGASSMQTLTVIVRQMALGRIAWGKAAPMLKKELTIALLNGLIFALLATIIAYVRFSSWYIAAAMAAAMLVSFIMAGVLASFVPLGLRALRIDPAIASSVIVMTLVDVIGFFSFLGFATLWVPQINT